MKKIAVDFLKRGLLGSVFGPVIIAVIYLILNAQGVMESICTGKIAVEILSSVLLAFIAAGISVVYEIEKLPLLYATVIHSFVLYLDYILIYLFNGWLRSRLSTVLGFTAIYIVFYAVIWLCIYLSIRAKTRKINAALKSE
ncbi:MAG: DUF3021 domain-containing protein [Candidatus Limivicinus sp.]|jgi:hypothetical protein